MGDQTSISWAESTWNPIRGCTRVSPGCGGPGPHGGCYAEGIAARFSGPGQPYEGIAEFRGGKPRWTGKLAFVEQALTLPLRWKRPRRIFVNSMSDLFHEAVPDEWIDRVFAVMALAPQHSFQVLTKRSARMCEYMLDSAAHERVTRAAIDLAPANLKSSGNAKVRIEGVVCYPAGPWPLPNVWLGVSAEDQRRADERVPDLLATPAAVRFVSAEPLLGAIDFTVFPRAATAVDQQRPGFERVEKFWFNALNGEDGVVMRDKSVRMTDAGELPSLDWIIVGGESGHCARPMDLSWARSVVEQCRVAGVACFVKQMGTHPTTNIDEQRAWVMRSRKGDDPAEWPSDLRVQEMPHA